MREAEEVEGLGLPLSKILTLLGRVAAKADQPGFVRFPPRSPQRKRPRCSTASSVLLPRPTPHPRACSSFGFCLHEPVRRALPVTDEASQVPCKELLHVRKVSDCARFSHPSHYAMGDVAFSSAERDRHLGIRPVSQLNTWPVVSPVNASRRPSRDAAHHSGLGRLARPFPWRTFTSYSLPASPAHSEMGHSLQIVARRKSVHVRNAPKATVGHQG